MGRKTGRDRLREGWIQGVGGFWTRETFWQKQVLEVLASAAPPPGESERSVFCPHTLIKKKLGVPPGGCWCL